MNANVLSIQGKNVESVELPQQFNEPLRVDLIRRAYHAQRTTYLQPKGIFPLAGLQNTAAYYGRRHAWRQTINTGRSRLPREKLPKGRSGAVKQVPHAKGGRRAHPPKPSKTIIEKINLKEKNAAIRSAISATAIADVVKARGHSFVGNSPLVVEDKLQEVKKAKEMRSLLSTLGLDGDLMRSKEGRRMRSGRARLRRGGYRTPKSALIVIAKDNGAWKAARNIPGVDVVAVEKLTVEDLAPGGHPGRLTVWTKGALKEMNDKKLFY